jgi:hypothetical protein
LATVVAVLLTVYGSWAILDELSHGGERREREGARKMIAEVQAGATDSVRLDSRDEMDEFVKGMSVLKDAKDLTFDIEYIGMSYAGGVDEFLRQIRGYPGVTTLRLIKTGVTDAGMEHVATLPNLEELILFQQSITDVGLEKLVTSPKLERLEFSSYKKVSIPAIVALPHLLRLRLYDTYGADRDESIGPDISAFEKAQSLSELTLLGFDVSPEAVEGLRSHLPNCRVTAYRRIAGRDKQEIAPLNGNTSQLP